MSLILDALRKSERTRRQSLTGQLGAGETHGVSRLPIPWMPLLGLLLLANALLLAFLWPRGEKPVATVPAAAAGPSVYHPAVRPLAQENIAPDDVPDIPPPPPVSRLTPPGNPSLAAAIPAEVPPAVQSAAQLPVLAALPPEARAALPALHLDVLGYATKPANRFVVINLKQYHIGDVLAEGPVVKDIVPRGAVLEFHGSAFLLPAS